MPGVFNPQDPEHGPTLPNGNKAPLPRSGNMGYRRKRIVQLLASKCLLIVKLLVPLSVTCQLLTNCLRVFKPTCFPTCPNQRVLLLIRRILPAGSDVHGRLVFTYKNRSETVFVRKNKPPAYVTSGGQNTPDNNEVVLVF